MDNSFIPVDDFYRAVDVGNVQRAEEILNQKHRWVSFEHDVLNENDCAQVLYSAMLLAVQEDQLEILPLLLSHVSPDAELSGPIVVACRRGRTQHLRLILDGPHTAHLTPRDVSGAMIDAIEHQHFECLRMLLHCGVDLNGHEQHVMRKAIDTEQSQIVAMLLTNEHFLSKRTDWIAMCLRSTRSWADGNKSNEDIADVLYDFQACEDAIEDQFNTPHETKHRPHPPHFYGHILFRRYKAEKEAKMSKQELSEAVGNVPSNLVKRKM